MKRSTIKRALENIKIARTQVDGIERTLKRVSSDCIKDSVKGSLPEFPYTEHTVVVEGSKRNEHARLEKELEQKKEVWLHKQRVAERVLEKAEPEMQDILRRYYGNGQSMESIGNDLGYTKGRISQKIKDFFESDQD